MIDEAGIRARHLAIKDGLDERGRRLFVAAEKAAAGRGGTAAVFRATGVARSTIIRGAQELAAVPAASAGPARAQRVRVRRAGGGRPRLSRANPAVLDDLRCLVEPATLGDPMRPLLWVSKSREKLVAATTTKTGLTVQCELDENSYAKGRRVTDQDMAALNIETNPWHPEWNYTIKPRTKR